jgi:hypothetical protein
MSQNYEDQGEYSDTEFNCRFCGEDRFRNAFGCSIHSAYYCLQNPNRLPVPKPRNELWDGPQYYYPVEEDLARQRERQARIEKEKQENGKTGQKGQTGQEGKTKEQK